MPRAQASLLTLEEAAEALGVHYMTVYRYIRLGRLPAEWREGRWFVAPSDLKSVTRPLPTSNGGASRRTRDRNRNDHVKRLVDRLIAGDGPGSWAIVESALAARAPAEVYLQLIGPSLKELGDGWADGRVTVGDEHKATAVALGLVGRLGPLFARRGRRRVGEILLAGAPGDSHAIPLIMVADMLRAEGFDVTLLGADTPESTLIDTATSMTDLRVVGLSMSTERSLEEARRAILALHEVRPGVPIIAGGPAVPTEEVAVAIGADGWAPDAAAAVLLIGHLSAR